MIHEVTREWFMSETTPRRRNPLEGEMHDYHHPNDPHMILVDFGLQVEPRAYDERRVVGDDAFHFGPPARTLSIQLLAHEMHKSICFKGGRGGGEKRKRTQRRD
jgi:hypothetical protein